MRCGWALLVLATAFVLALIVTAIDVIKNQEVYMMRKFWSRLSKMNPLTPFGTFVFGLAILIILAFLALGIANLLVIYKMSQELKTHNTHLSSISIETTRLRINSDHSVAAQGFRPAVEVKNGEKQPWWRSE